MSLTPRNLIFPTPPDNFFLTPNPFSLTLGGLAVATTFLPASLVAVSWPWCFLVAFCPGPCVVASLLSLFYSTLLYYSVYSSGPFCIFLYSTRFSLPLFSTLLFDFCLLFSTRLYSSLLYSTLLGSNLLDSILPYSIYQPPANAAGISWA